MFITMIGNSFYSQEHPPVEGVMYSLRFEIDHAAIESGTYVYGPENSSARRLGSGEVGLSAFYELRMRIKLRNCDYKTVTADIDLAMQKLLASNQLSELPQAAQKGDKGGSAIVVKISANAVKIDYHVYRDFKGPQNQFYFKTQVFAITKIPLD
jgi:hypothetical protein